MTEESSGPEEETRRVTGLHLVSMEIWVLKVFPLLDGCWYLVESEPM